MECLKCGENNPENVMFCHECGESMNRPSSDALLSHEEDVEGLDGPVTVTITEEDIVTRQSEWAYLLATIPWLILFVGALIFDFFTFGIFPTILATYFVGSRYLSFRRTVYIATDDHLIIQQGSLMGQRRIALSIGDLSDVLVQPGMFGRYLGFTRVSLQTNDGRRVLLHYVRFSSLLLERLRQRMQITEV